jgi:hypothetical protein
MEKSWNEAVLSPSSKGQVCLPVRGKKVFEAGSGSEVLNVFEIESRVSNDVRSKPEDLKMFVSILRSHTSVGIGKNRMQGLFPEIRVYF